MSRKEVNTPDAGSELVADVAKIIAGNKVSADDFEVPVARTAKEAIESAAFYADVLDVTFSQPRDHNDFVTARVGVNGVNYEYPRNNSVCKVPRSVVEVLARSKVQSVRTKMVKAEDGSDQYIPVLSDSHTYPFAVVRDPRGQPGFSWLQGILNERMN